MRDHAPQTSTADQRPAPQETVAQIFDRALVLHRLGRLDEAAILYETILRDCPEHVPSLCCLSFSRIHRGRCGEAAQLGRRVVSLTANSPEAWNSLGNAQAAQGANRDAVRSFRKMLLLRPSAEAHNNLGNAFQASEAFADAAAEFLAAILLTPDYSYAYNNLGSVLQALDRSGEALAYFRRATRLAPHDAVAHGNVGIAATEAGLLDEAFSAFTRAAELAPHHGKFHRMLADTGRVAVDSLQWQRMEHLAQDMVTLPEAEQTELHFALAKVYGDAAQYERSFRHLLAGNRLKRRTILYNEVEGLAVFERIQAEFTAERVTRKPSNGVPSRLPVFLVGMPRSGTTLVEQILASHPQVFGAGELLDLRRLVDAEGVTTFPEGAAAATRETLQRIGSAYLEGIRPRAPTSARILDKMPSNFKLIGLIHMALPDAKIIHIRRDPIDTCLSCFSKLFIGPQPYAYDLAELGRYFRAYARLMRHWHTILPPGVMLDVFYEDVVADLEGQARRLLDHCGLSWNDRCLAFHRNDRLVRTASAAQVRQPLYGDAVGRWHIYGDLVQPLLDALKE